MRSPISICSSLIFPKIINSRSKDNDACALVATYFDARKLDHFALSDDESQLPKIISQCLENMKKWLAKVFYSIV